MFEKRLWVFVLGMAAVAAVIILRLVDLQVVHAAEFRQLVGRVTPIQRAYIRPARGSILDRTGRLLASDEPSSDVTMPYRALSRDPAFFRTMARRMQRAGDYPAEMSINDITLELHRDLERTRQRVADLVGLSLPDLAEREKRIVNRVERIREAVLKQSPTVKSLREEAMAHAVLQNLDQKTAVDLQLALGRQPWYRVQPGSYRRIHDADTMAHLIGRLGAADPKRIAADPFAGDELVELRPGDLCGISGVERLAETTLRGVRGRLVEDIARGTTERVESVRGRDVFLTIDAELQERAYRTIEAAVRRLADDEPKSNTHPAGGAAVVVDADTGEVLVAASYPTYQVAEFRARYDEMQRDRIGMPLRPRALQVSYPPGSTCKAITAFGALADGAIDPNERIHCTGHLLPNKPDIFRCWIFNQFRTTHDASDNPAGQRAEDAIRNSCNIYFFRAAENLGPQRLCHWFDEFGFGRRAGTGLIEDSAGVNPTAKYLRDVQNRDFERADVWNWSIGQGEVTATPLQVANVAAAIASGKWRPAFLVRDSAGAPIATSQPLAPRHLDENAMRVVRKGMWRVVNEEGGSAHPYATLHADAGDYVLCGKTGSAQAQPIVLNFRFIFEHPDGRREEVIALNEDDASDRFGEDPPKLVGRFAHDRYPSREESEKLPAHAWFMGFTQARSVAPGDPPRGRKLAIAVIIEFGGAGGRVAGPVARDIIEACLGLRRASG